MVTIMAGVETLTNGNDREAAPPECRENPWPRWLSFVTMGLASLVWAIGGRCFRGPRRLPLFAAVLAAVMTSVLPTPSPRYTLEGARRSGSSTGCSWQCQGVSI